MKPQDPKLQRMLAPETTLDQAYELAQSQGSSAANKPNRPQPTGKIKNNKRKRRQEKKEDVARDEGAALLADVQNFLSRFIAYPSEHAKIAHTLWIAHAQLIRPR
jgi:hypothetical protein